MVATSDLPSAHTLLDADSIWSAAEASAGVTDVHRGLFQPNFDALVSSVLAEAKLNPLGVKLTQKDLVRSLTRRLATDRAVADHPAILDERIERPIFLTGLPRAGTTFFQYLFNQDASLRLVRTWEAAEPAPPPALYPDTVQPRIDRVAEVWRKIVERSPSFDAIHLSDPEGSEECYRFLDEGFVQAGQFNNMNVPSCMRYLYEKADFVPVYRNHARQLQLLQHCAPRRRWVLKYPNHLLCMDAILAVHPDASFVITHRDPAVTVASIAKLTWSLRGARSDHCDKHEIGAQMVDFIDEHIRRLMDFCASSAARGRVFHADYYALVKSPVEPLATVYRQLGLTMDDAARARVAQWHRDNPKGARGKNTYGFEEFGLDVEALNRRFADYRARFGVPIEAAAAL